MSKNCYERLCWNKGGVGALALQYCLLNIPRSFLWILYVIYVSCLSCWVVCSLQPCGYLLGKGWPLGTPVYDVFLCFCYFPIWCLWSGLVLDCIDSWSYLLPYFSCYHALLRVRPVNATITYYRLTHDNVRKRQRTITKTWYSELNKLSLPQRDVCQKWKNTMNCKTRT